MSIYLWLLLQVVLRVWPFLPLSTRLMTEMDPFFSHPLYLIQWATVCTNELRWCLRVIKAFCAISQVFIWSFIIRHDMYIFFHTYNTHMSLQSNYLNKLWRQLSCTEYLTKQPWSRRLWSKTKHIGSHLNPSCSGGRDCED
jgi:hypothetical protein